MFLLDLVFSFLITHWKYNNQGAANFLVVWNGRSQPKSMVQCSAGTGGRLHAGFQADFTQGERVEESRTKAESEPRRLRAERGAEEGARRRSAMATAR